MAWRDKLHIFRFWSQKVLPQVYDDALSYYEVLNKVAAFLNECIEKINELIDEQEAYEDAMNQAWENFKIEMKDEWKAYKVLMETTWNDFKQYILDNLDTWEEETRQQVIDNINNELEIIIANLKDELKLYIDGTRTVTVHITKENNVITADKTYTEIRNIINEGGYVILNYDNHIYRYQYVGDEDYIEWVEEGAYYTQVQPHYTKINTIIDYILQVSSDNTWSEREDEYVVTPDIGASNYGKFLKSTSAGVVWSNTPDELPSYTQTESGKVLKVNSAGDGVEWGVDGTGDTLPSYGPSDANKVLKVNSSGNDIAWEDDDDTKELPNIVSGDGNKILRVKNDLSGVEWSPESKELPSYSASDANKVLRLNGSGTAVEWGNMTQEVNVGSFSNPSLPAGFDFASVKSKLESDANSVVVIATSSYGDEVYRCIRIGQSTLTFVKWTTVTTSGTTSGDLVTHEMFITSTGITTRSIRFTGTVE